MAKTAPRSLAGKAAVVTGGGRGIGQAIARALAREGAVIAIGDLDGQAALAVARELGGQHIGLALDVTDRPAFTAFLDEVERRLGPLAILVNNAGIMPVGPLEDEDDASVTRQLEINLHAVIHGTREAMRRMRPRGSGHIVNIASMAGKTAYANMATYCATKHGVVGLSEAARLELRGTGIEVSVVMPGVVRTELSTGLRSARGVKVVAPDDVAEAVVGALKVPRFDVFVPRTGGAIIQLGGALPRRVRDAIVRAMHADQVATHVDRGARAAYEARAAHSAPHVDHVAEVEDHERQANAA